MAFLLRFCAILANEKENKAKDKTKVVKPEETETNALVLL